MERGEKGLGGREAQREIQGKDGHEDDGAIEDERERFVEGCGVGQPTLSRWLREAKVPVMARKKKPTGSKRWTPKEKLRVVLAAAAAGDILLLVPPRRRVESQDCRLGGARDRMRRPRHYGAERGATRGGNRWAR